MLFVLRSTQETHIKPKLLVPYLHERGLSVPQFWQGVCFDNAWPRLGAQVSDLYGP
uniref:Uncharacterized protein n=1 Tax=Anguilla anguilla TaxID=7936 RepID=A0A0E9R706_ANGAN